MAEMFKPPFYAYKGDEPYIFISYAHKDSEKVFPIITRFRNDGFNIWYDEGIDPGNEWPLEIERALKSCAVFLVFITANSVRSRNVRNEINFALANNLPFLAIYLEDTELIEGLGLQMGSTQAIMQYRMDDAAFYYKSESVFEQMISAERSEPIVVSVEKPAESIKTNKNKIIKLAIAIGGGVILFIVVIYFLIVALLLSGNDKINSPIGISFVSPDTAIWLIEEDDHTLYFTSGKLESSQIWITNITEDVMTAGDDIETVIYNKALSMANNTEIYGYKYNSESNSAKFSFGDFEVDVRIWQENQQVFADMIIYNIEIAIENKHKLFDEYDKIMENVSVYKEGN